MYLNTTSSFPSALGNQLVLSYSYDTAVASYMTAITALSLSLLTAGWLEPGCPPSSIYNDSSSSRNMAATTSDVSSLYCASGVLYLQPARPRLPAERGQGAGCLDSYLILSLGHRSNLADSAHCCLSLGTDTGGLPPHAPAPPRKQLSRTSAGRGQMSSPLRVKLVNLVR